jgi:hypothetical protein
MSKFYGTFGSRHLEGKGHRHYVEIRAPTAEIAREAMFAVFGRRWSFIYTAEEFADQPDQFKITCYGVVKSLGDEWYVEKSVAQTP